MVYKSVKIWAKSFLFIGRVFGISSEIIDLHKLKPGPKIICCNHQSYYEIIMLLSVLERPVFIMKKSIMKVPLFSIYMKKMNMIAIDRATYNFGWMDKAKDAFKEGKTLVIFPEGTRVPIGKEVPYKKGAFKLAKEVGMNIVPAKTNSAECWEGPGFIKKGYVYLRFFDEISPDPELLRKYIG
ncbi:lysophospholipid acyltransferase family protein [Candidatus Nesciobacter abundans]|nr:lysophospholipid acyltransferase family protein [Candidatus Nesciobacter abundans]